jgi:hypothetical protein
MNPRLLKVVIVGQGNSENGLCFVEQKGRIDGCQRRRGIVSQSATIETSESDVLEAVQNP